MKIELKVSSGMLIAELTVSTQNATITEDIAASGRIHGDEQEQLISTANEITRFNKGTDIDFVEMVAIHCLHTHEIESLIERLKEQV